MRLGAGHSPLPCAQEIRTAQTFAAFPVHYRIHLYVAAAFATVQKVTQDGIASKAAMFSMLKTRAEDQRHIIGAFELLCQARGRFRFLVSKIKINGTRSALSVPQS